MTVTVTITITVTLTVSLNPFPNSNPNPNSTPIRPSLILMNQSQLARLRQHMDVWTINFAWVNQWLQPDFWHAGAAAPRCLLALTLTLTLTLVLLPHVVS